MQQVNLVLLTLDMAASARAHALSTERTCYANSWCYVKVRDTRTIIGWSILFRVSFSSFGPKL